MSLKILIVCFADASCRDVKQHFPAANRTFRSSSHDDKVCSFSFTFLTIVTTHSCPHIANFSSLRRLHSNPLLFALFALTTIPSLFILRLLCKSVGSRCTAYQPTRYRHKQANNFFLFFLSAALCFTNLGCANFTFQLAHGTKQPRGCSSPETM